jgi:hypothetical protein
VERIGHRSGTPGWRWVGVAWLLGVVGIGMLAAARPAQAAPADQNPFHDRVIRGADPIAKTATSASLPRYLVAGGGSVSVQVDPAFAGGGALQRVLDTLGQTVHGPEMNKLTVHIADLGNLYKACGQGATACYYPASQTMVVSGSPVNLNNAMPQGMVISHEYGHHIEANRSLPGWNASNLGARHWATYERVCEGVAGGTLFPGDQGAHYWENPGEAFAQAYATMLYPDAVPWWWHFAEPDEGAFAAIRADVADTSSGNTTRWARKLAPGSPSAATTVSTPVDGPIDVRLRQPRKARFELALRSADGRVLRRARAVRRAKGKSKTPVSELSYSTCGAQSVTVEVRRKAGRGRFNVQIQKP